jgi:hypothetical protein
MIDEYLMLNGECGKFNESEINIISMCIRQIEKKRERERESLIKNETNIA